MDPSANSSTGEAHQTPPLRFSTQLVEDWHDLESMAEEWDALAGDAIEGSPSSESWMLLPSLRYLAEGTTIKVLVIRATDVGAGAACGRLCGVFPFQVFGDYHGLPVRTFRLWNHMYSLFPAPLLRRDAAGDCIRTMLTWLATERPHRVFLEFPDLRADSEFYHQLSEVLRNDGTIHQIVDVATRAVFRLRHDAESYLQQISTMRLRRYERRLSEMGAVSFDEYPAAADAAAWLDEFAALEMSGWKGRSGTAFGSKPSHRAWLLEVGKAAAARGRLMMLAMRLDGRPIAMKLNILSDSGGYAFKTAFDEAYSRYSPGTLLELEHIRRLHANSDISWMDSLAGPEHSLANRVWRDRTAVVTLLVAPASLLSEFALSLLPFFRWLKRRVRGNR